MIETVFRGSRAMCEVVFARRLQVKRFIAHELGGAHLSPDMIRLDCVPFGDLSDPSGNDWTLDVTAHYNQGRADQADTIAGRIAEFIITNLTGDEIGAVTLNLPFMGVAYSHGPLGTAFRSLGEQHHRSCD